MSGSVLSGQYTDLVMKRLAKSKGLENVYPELRLYATFPSFFLIPAGYLIYGWSSQKAVAVYAPFIGPFLCKYISKSYPSHFTNLCYLIDGLGQLSAFTPTFVHFVVSKPGRSSSAVAINNFATCCHCHCTHLLSSCSGSWYLVFYFSSDQCTQYRFSLLGFGLW